jgi:hypothetical protein
MTWDTMISRPGSPGDPHVDSEEGQPMTRYTAERPTPADANARVVDTAAMYFRVICDGYGPDYAAERTAGVIEDLLTVRQTGIYRPSALFGDRETCAFWDAATLDQIAPS